MGNPLTVQARALRAIGDRTTKIPASDIHLHIKTITNLHDNQEMLQEFFSRHPKSTTKELLSAASSEQSKELQANRQKGGSSTRINQGITDIKDKSTVIKGMILD